MSAPVWILSVDLQTNTAAWTTGLGEAAKSARSSFRSIGDDAETMGARTGHSFGSLRSNLGLVDNVVRGAHAQAMADLVRLWSQNAIVMGALPIAATAAGLVLIGGLVYELASKLHALKLAQEKYTSDTAHFGTTAQEAYNKLEDRILSAEQKTDELRNDHLGALQKQLELINHQSMSDLMKSLEGLDKASDTVFKDMASHWYAFWEGGAAGAKKSLSDFETQYNTLLSGHDAGGASNALHSKLEREKKLLADMQTMQAAHGDNTDESWAASLELLKVGASYAEKDVNAQRQLVTILERQVQAEAARNKLTKDDSANARTQTGHEESQRHSAAAREAAGSMLQMGITALSAARAQADAVLTIHRKSLEERLTSDEGFAKSERDVKLAANQADIAALDKSGKDYQNQLQTLNDKALQIQSEFDAKIATLRAAESVAANTRDLANLRLAEREKVDATREGSAERLAAIDAAIKNEEAHHLQETQQYRDLLAQRAEVERAAAQEAQQQKESAARESAAHTEKMDLLGVAAKKEKFAVEDALRGTNRERQKKEALQLANETFAIKQTALAKEIQALITSEKGYQNKLKELNNKELELARAHQNELAAIKGKATAQSNAAILSGETQLQQRLSEELTQSIMRHQTWGKMIYSVGEQAVTGMIQHAIMSMLTADMTKEKDAAKAARMAFNWGLEHGGPAAPVLAPVLAAGAFATEMAFAKGGIVPGVGRGDIVPAMLTPGEGIVPGGVMDGLRNVARNGGFDGPRSVTHIHVHPTYNVQAIDGDGMQAALEKHADQIHEHVKGTLRKMNR